MEQIEDDEEDHKILAILPGESMQVTDEIKKILKEFAEHVFDHLEGKKMHIGNFHGKEIAEKHIEKCRK